MSLTPDHVAALVASGIDRLYHVTDAESLPAILSVGLWPNRLSQFDRHLLRTDCSYLCTLRVARDDLLGSHDVSWGDAVISAALADLDPARLVADEDYWRGSARAAGVGPSAKEILAAFPLIDTADEVAEALRDGGTVAYRELIPPSIIRLELIPPRDDLPGLAAYRTDLRMQAHYGTGLTDPGFLANLARFLRVPRAEF